MIHQRQRLAFGFKAGDDVFRVHPRFNDLQRYLAGNRLFLLSNVNDAEAPFADLLAEFVGSDLRAQGFVY